MMTIGTQTFGLGRELTEDFTGTLRKLHDIGFQAIEPAVIPVRKQGNMPRNMASVESFEVVANTVAQLGMQIPSVHMFAAYGMFTMPTETIVKSILEIHEKYGVRDFVISGMFHNLAGAKKYAKLIRTLSDKIRPHGCRILYHNHDDEFQKIRRRGNTQTAMDALRDLAGEDLLLQLDIGWAGMAGDEVKIAENYGNQIVSIHLKDFYPDYRSDRYCRKNLPTEAFAPIGSGAIATGKILAMTGHFQNFGGHIIIDQDKSDMDMLKALEIGYGNIAAVLAEV